MGAVDLVEETEPQVRAPTEPRRRWFYVGLAAWFFLIVSVVAVWNPWRLVALDGQLRSGALVATLVLFTAAAIPRTSPNITRTVSRLIAGTCWLLIVVLIGPVLAIRGWVNAYFTPNGTTTTHKGDVEVIRTTGNKMIDSDDCVLLELRVGDGLLKRHRSFFRCEVTPPGWEAIVIDDHTLQLTHHDKRCLMRIDRSSLVLTPLNPTQTCGFD